MVIAPETSPTGRRAAKAAASAASSPWGRAQGRSPPPKKEAPSPVPVDEAVPMARGSVRSQPAAPKPSLHRPQVPLLVREGYYMVR